MSTGKPQMSRFIREQNRRDVASDPDLGNHLDEFVAARHHVSRRTVAEIRQGLGIASPRYPKRTRGSRGLVDWSKYRTPKAAAES